ncbi:MAG: class I SAM-dependent methyltransferase [Acidimicrobiales bacterium]
MPLDQDALGFDPGKVFDAVASNYEANRPTYPAALFDALERAVGPLAGRRVLDVGAGTGISARALAQRGALVVAVDPSHAMATTLRDASSGLAASLGRAEALPVADGAAQLVTFAQAWHWVRLPDAAVECRRVLAPGGRLALWWNVSEDEGAFFDALLDECGIDRYGGRDRQDDRSSLVEVGGFASVRHDAVRWRWSVPLEHWMSTVQTRSELAKLGPGAGERLGAIEAVARRFFPDGVVAEWFTARLAVAVP